MLNSKLQTLFSVQTQTTSDNSFVKAGLKKTAITRSENGAMKYSSTGNPFVDQFGKLGEYKGIRAYDSIATDTSTLWALNPALTIAFIFYLRIITRVVSFFDGTKTSTVQRGAGLKHESIMRMFWLHVNHPDTFWKNITLFINVGSWKDIITMLSYDLQFNGWDKRMLNWDQFGKLILAGLENKNTSELLKKYLPTIRPNTKCTTIESQADNIIGKWIASLVFGTKEKGYSSYKKYRLLKSSGTAHQWQQLISQGKHQLVNFDTVHGRALALMVSGKYLENNGLTKKYEEWIDSKPVAKYTGYPHELFNGFSSNKTAIQKKTINSQFLGLVETAKRDALNTTSMIVVRDTSSSMGSPAIGSKMSCFGIAKAIALFFSYMLPTGAFANSWIEFNSSAKLHLWKGSNPVECWLNDHSNYIGSTNFESVIDLFGRIKASGIPDSQFPSGIICISDVEFDPSKQLAKTNVEATYSKLRSYGFSEEYVENFKIVLWNLQRHWAGDKFETYGDAKNVFYFSGYDPSTIAFLTGLKSTTSITNPKTAAELFAAAMDQEILHMVEV